VDPSTTLAEIRDLVLKINVTTSVVERARLGEELAEKVSILDTWMSLGCFLPEPWERGSLEKI
jgi:hypothetical protein